MIASLPMYDWPEAMMYNDLFWNNLRTSLLSICGSVPEQLTRTDVHKQWQRDDVLLSQTCIYPLVTELPSTTEVVGTPLYKADHCDNGNYASVLLVRRSDDRNNLGAFVNATLAYNSKDSQSGFNALKSMLVELQLINTEKPVFFSRSVQTSSHRNSIDAVASGSADICAVDPVSWALAQRFDNAANKLQVLTVTAFSPALPLITSKAAIPASFERERVASNPYECV